MAGDQRRRGAGSRGEAATTRADMVDDRHLRSSRATTVTISRRTRVSVAQADLVIQPTPDDADAFAPRRFGEVVTELDPTPDDRSAGRRRFEVIVDGWRFEATTE